MNEKLRMIKLQFEDLYDEWKDYVLVRESEGFTIESESGVPLSLDSNIASELISDLALIIKRNGLYIDSREEILKLKEGYDVTSEEGLDELAYELEDLFGNLLYNLDVYEEDGIKVDYEYIGNPTIGEKQSLDNKIKNIIEKYEFI